MKPAKAAILIVEDDPAIRDGLCDVLIYHGFAVDCVSEGHRGLDAILTGSYDLVLLDVMLPGMDGISICRQVRAKRPCQMIIMITAKGSEDDIVNGFKAGADDYVPKPFSLRELMVRVEAVLRRGGKPQGDEKITWGQLVFDGLNLQMVLEHRSQDLTRREMDMIAYIHRHQDRIVSKKELLTEVWHYADADIETRTIDIHMLKLRKKFVLLKDDLTVIRTIRGEGYRWEPAP